MKPIPVTFGLDVSVVIRRETDTDTAFVDVLCPMYKAKKFTMPHSYRASHFTDAQIINDSDFIRVMFNHFPS